MSEREKRSFDGARDTIMCTPRELAHTSSLFISNFTPGKLERNKEAKKNISTK